MRSLSLSRPILIGLGCAILLAGAPGSATAEDNAKTKDVITFTVTNLEHSRGKVRCSIYRESGWLETPVAEVTAKIVGKKATCRFRGISSGTYGLAGHHDEDGDDELDTNFVGIPSEGLCASNNATGSFGPPSFDDAKFRYRGGKKALSAKMVY